MSKHAVFMDRTHRVSAALSWDKAQELFEKLDDERRADGNARPGTDSYLYYEVRSLDDPAYKALPFLDLSTRKLDHVRLSRPERERLLDIGRRAGGRDDAADAIMSELLCDPHWAHLEAIVISDYAWAAANFCFPQEARYL